VRRRVIRITVIITLVILTAYILQPELALAVHTPRDEQNLELLRAPASAKKPKGTSIAPILAFDSTFGVVYGAALFLSRPEQGYDLATKFNATTESDLALFLDYRQWSTAGYFYRLEVVLDGFEAPYYGEGGDTREVDEVRIDRTALMAKFHLRLRQGSRIQQGLYLDYRLRHEVSVDGDTTSRLFPDESRLGFGYGLVYDTRDSAVRPTRGIYQKFSLLYLPESTSTLNSAHTCFQGAVDMRGFYSLPRGMILAGRFSAGDSWSGDPTYLYRYSLGGSQNMRGYFFNRFRGKRFYLTQTELRFPILGIVSGAVFADVGDIGDSGFGSPKSTYGGGLRFLIPPDNVAKVRFDYGVGEDQESIYFVFGEAF